MRPTMITSRRLCVALLCVLAVQVADLAAGAETAGPESTPAPRRISPDDASARATYGGTAMQSSNTKLMMIHSDPHQDVAAFSAPRTPHGRIVPRGQEGANQREPSSSALQLSQSGRTQRSVP